MKNRKMAIPSDLRKKVLERDGYRCRYCGSFDGPFEMDHVYPESKGGETSVKNIVTACHKCNNKKSYNVGLWPKPIGYFDEIEEQKIIEENLNNANKKLSADAPYLFILFVVIGSFISSIHVFYDLPKPASDISILAGLLVGFCGFAFEIGWRMKGR